jgi:hypothetical protein
MSTNHYRHDLKFQAVPRQCGWSHPRDSGASSHELGDLMGAVLEVTWKLAQRATIHRARRLQGRSTDE